MKNKKSVRKTKKIEVTEAVEVCMCRVHILMEAGKKDALPCIGHGKNCPCTEKLEAEKIAVTPTAEVPAETPIVANPEKIL